MGLPIVTLSRLIDRSRLRLLRVGVAWRIPATVLLLALVLPVLLTAAAVSLPVMLTVGLAVGVRRAWHWPSRRGPADRDAD